MYRILWKSILILLVTACATTAIPNHEPLPPTIPPPAIAADLGPWSFGYASDTLKYRVSRSAAVETHSDSGSQREISTNTTQGVLIITRMADTVHYAATVDTFSTANQGRIGPVQSVTMPVHSTGVLVDSLLIQSDSADTELTCNPAQSALEGDLRNLLISFPRRLAPGASWRDSTIRLVCYGTIPMRAAITRSFSVIGRSSYNGQSAVAIQRTDSINAHGEGRQQQHQLSIDATGTGTALYYISPERSSLVHISTSQNLDFSIRASGRASRFHEDVREEFNLLR